MIFDLTRARIAGVLYLLIFVSGIAIYQVLRGPYVFSDEALTTVAAHASSIIASVLLSFSNGTLTILVALLLAPVFKRHGPFLAQAYLAFCIVNFAALALENHAALSLLEASRAYVARGIADSTILQSLGMLAYETHRWAHYTYLLLSCLPVFVLYYTLFAAKLVPRVLSIFGLGAVVLMFADVTLTLFDISTNPYMLLPMGLIQLALPLWLLAKGFKPTAL
ncbi:MAG: hypothetical protein RhofKO_33690 [Rhodothermales bacterium]